MKTKRLLTVLAAMLLSVGIANAQTDVTQNDDNGNAPASEVVQGDDTSKTDGENETTAGDDTGKTDGQNETTSGDDTSNALQNEKMPGDVDDNGSVDADDVTALVSIILGKEGAKGYGDVNGDKKVLICSMVHNFQLMRYQRLPEKLGDL